MSVTPIKKIRTQDGDAPIDFTGLVNTPAWIKTTASATLEALGTVPVSGGGTGGTTKQTAREGIGIYAGSTAPETFAAQMQTGDIYLYFPEA